MQVLYGVEGLGKTGREGRFRKELEEAVGFPAGLLGALHGEALRAGHIVTGVGDFASCPSTVRRVSVKIGLALGRIGKVSLFL